VWKLKMRGGISPLPQYIFMAWCLVKHRDNFNVYLCYFLLWSKLLSALCFNMCWIFVYILPFHLLVLIGLSRQVESGRAILILTLWIGFQQFTNVLLNQTKRATITYKR
jgi:hypothetical protein